MGPLTQTIMLQALALLDQKLSQKITLILGGGGAMILAHGFPKGTVDVDAIPVGGSIEDLLPMIKEVANELRLDPDWLNPHFSTYSHTLPTNYQSRLVMVYQGTNLKVEALGKEEMLIMKCFAHRTKDIPHARSLIRGGVKLEIVEDRFDELKKKKIPGTEKAILFLQELLDAEDEGK